MSCALCVNVTMLATVKTDLPALRPITKCNLDAKLASEADAKDFEKQVVAKVQESVKSADKSPSW